MIDNDDSDEKQKNALDRKVSIHISHTHSRKRRWKNHLTLQ